MCPLPSFLGCSLCSAKDSEVHHRIGSAVRDYGLVEGHFINPEVADLQTYTFKQKDVDI